MISPQARLIKQLLKLGNSQAPSDIPKERLVFEKNMRLLFPTLSNKHVRHSHIANVPVEYITPHTARRTIIYIHGGAFALGSSRAYRQHMVRLARLSDAALISIEYALAPEHPYPHAVDQLCDVWAALARKKDFSPAAFAFVGDSAGANILLSCALKLKTTGLPLPACLVLLSAGLDATFDGESYTKNAQKDPMFTMESLDFYMRNYVQSHDKRDPHVSPVFADLHGLPPILIHVGSEEMMLSTSLKLYENAKRDGADAELFVGDGMWHGWHLFAGFVPEAKTAMRAVGAYIKSHTT